MNYKSQLTQICSFVLVVALNFSIFGDANLSISTPGTNNLVIYQSKAYEVRFQNFSSDSLKMVRIEGKISENLRLRKTDPEAIIADGIISWQVSEIHSGEEYRCKIEVMGVAIGAGEIKLQAYYGDKTIAAEQALLIDGTPAVHVSSYDTEDPVIVGKDTVYVVELRNEGTKYCENVRLVNFISENMELSEVLMQDGAKYSYDAENRALTFDAIPRLERGEKISYKIRCKALKEGIAKNKAIFTVDSFSKEVINEESTQIRSDDIQGAAMHIISYDTEDPVEVGQKTIYVVDIRNEGYEVYQNVNVAVELSDELEFMSSPQSHKVEGNKVIFTNVETIASGSKKIFEIQCRAAKAGLGKARVIITDGKATVIDEEVTSIY